MPKSEKIEVRISRGLKRLLVKEASRMGVSYADVVRAAIREYLNQNTKHVRKPPQ